jgi:hypothetical protein
MLFVRELVKSSTRTRGDNGKVIEYGLERSWCEHFTHGTVRINVKHENRRPKLKFEFHYSHPTLHDKEICNFNSSQNIIRKTNEG